MSAVTHATDATTAARRARVISAKAASVEDEVVQSGGVSLHGSAAMIAEYFSFGVNTILYQRGLYGPENFVETPMFGLTKLECDIPEVRTYLNNVFADMHEWMRRGQLQRVAVVVASAETGRVLERWRFDVNVDTSPEAPVVDVEEAKRAPRDDEERRARKKRYAGIVKGIRAVVCSITSSVALLPLLEDRCSFEVLLYTAECAQVPDTWVEVGPKLVEDARDLKLTSFSTSKHKIDAMVQYAKEEEGV